VSERPADPATSSAPAAVVRSLTPGALLAGLAVVAAVLGPVVARTGLLSAGTGEGIFRGAIPCAVIAIVLTIPAMRRSGRLLTGLGIILLAIAAAVLPIRGWIASATAPPIHDVSTDLDNPPRYVAVARLRVPPANPADYGGDAVARHQRESYADLRPLVVTAPPPRVLAMAVDTARAEGWTVLAQDIGFGDLGRLEATDTSFLFGRVDDIVVRVVPHPAGSRVDVRSSARADGYDAGRNAARIRRFLAFLAERAAAEPAGPPAQR
jgi:Protein of unknown function (DUF1499)